MKHYKIIYRTLQSLGSTVDYKHTVVVEAPTMLAAYQQFSDKDVISITPVD